MPVPFRQLSVCVCVCVLIHFIHSSLSASKIERVAIHPSLMLQLCHLQRLFHCCALLVVAHSSTGLPLRLLKHAHVGVEVNKLSDVTLV